MIDLSPPLRQKLTQLVTAWERDGRVARIWAGDASVWSGNGEDRWLGWLEIIGDQLAGLEPLVSLQNDVRRDAVTDAVVLGMGGSSLAPEVFATTFGRIPGAPRLHVLDSTDPAQVRTLESCIRYASTLFIVSSKSGTTLESTILFRYFVDRVRQTVGPQVGRHFIAVTDPGSPLETVATETKFRHVFHGHERIGGRFSALSHFGLVPAAVMGVDVREILTRAERMRRRCGAATPLSENPGARLGLALAAAAQSGRDKVTFVGATPYLGLGAWLEQLLAESTGKAGQGLIPVDGEPLGDGAAYGEDRIFVQLRDEATPDADQDDALDRLAVAGHPIVRIGIDDRLELGAEFFRWEFATAVVGSVLELNPFDQPDVDASKVETRRLTTDYETGQRLPEEPVLASSGGVTIYADRMNTHALRREAPSSVEDFVAAHCGRITPGDYVALLAYVERNADHAEILQQIRARFRARWSVATCVGFGPRFLHSTGQAYKGGPNTGVFFQITAEDQVDIPVPGEAYSFAVVKAAQANGDLKVLGDRGRRALRIHLDGKVSDGLHRLAQIVERVTQRA